MGNCTLLLEVDCDKLKMYVINPKVYKPYKP